MPLMIIKTSAIFSEEKANEVLKAGTKVLADLGRKESHAMVLLQKVDGMMGGSQDLSPSSNSGAWSGSRMNSIISSSSSSRLSWRKCWESRRITSI